MARSSIIVIPTDSLFFKQGHTEHNGIFTFSPCRGCFAGFLSSCLLSSFEQSALCCGCGEWRDTAFRPVLHPVIEFALSGWSLHRFVPNDTLILSSIRFIHARDSPASGWFSFPKSLPQNHAQGLGPTSLQLYSLPVLFY